MLSDLKALEERLEERLEKRIVTRVEQIVANNHEDTRRYFTIMVERVESAVALVAEVNSHHGVVLDDHEVRLKRIEKTRRT